MNEIAKNQVCIVMRNGVELWLDADRSASLQVKLLKQDRGQFLEFEGRVLNTADITGIYLASDMDSVTRRKNGEHQCKNGKWHDRGIKCDCPREMTSAEIVAYSTGRKT